MKRPSQYFRAGAGAVIVNSAGRPLLFERSDIAGSWQLPQGGLDKDEEPYPAILREVEEETGISPDELELITRYPEPLAYELPAPARKNKTGRGQVIYFFLFRFTGDEEALDLSRSKEFCKWRWSSARRMVELAVDFRRPVYVRVAQYFSEYLSDEE